MSAKLPEAQKLKQMMFDFRNVQDLPPPSVMHANDPSFKKFTHTSFGNVFQNIKKQMVASTSPVHGPDVEEEDDDEGEWLLVYKNYFISTLLTNFLPKTSLTP